MPRRRAAPRARSSLPRHHCRGLIEAFTAGFAALRLAIVFRGITAAASLKREIQIGLRQTRLYYVFRGITAAASLKPSMSGLSWILVVSVFRGITAAASLKLVEEGLTAVNLECLPRHHCRGLIEALPPRW